MAWEIRHLHGWEIATDFEVDKGDDVVIYRCASCRAAVTARQFAAMPLSEAALVARVAGRRGVESGVLKGKLKHRGPRKAT